MGKNTKFKYSFVSRKLLSPCVRMIRMRGGSVSSRNKCLLGTLHPSEPRLIACLKPLTECVDALSIFIWEFYVYMSYETPSNNINMHQGCVNIQVRSLLL